MIATINKTVSFSLIFLLFNCLSTYGGDLVKQSGVLTETLSGQSTFVVSGSSNINGKIKLYSRQGENIVISYEKTARTSSNAESSRFLELIDFKLDVREDRAIFRILSPTQAPWEGSDYSVNIEILIELPEKMNIEGRAGYIGFEIDGPFQGVDLKSTYSALDIRRIYGPVRAITTFGDVTLEAIKGETRIETENGKITAGDIIVPSGYAVFQATHSPIKLSGIQGPVEAYTSYSSIEARDIEASYEPVVLRTTYGAVNVVNVTGELICETSYAPITVSSSKINHGHSRIETSHAPITIQFDTISDCELYIGNDFSDVDLTIPETISTKLIAGTGRGGRIHAKNVNLRPTLLELTRLEAIIGDGESRIEVNVNGIGNINISGR